MIGPLRVTGERTTGRPGATCFMFLSGGGSVIRAPLICEGLDVSARLPAWLALSVCKKCRFLFCPRNSFVSLSDGVSLTPGRFHGFRLSISFFIFLFLSSMQVSVLSASQEGYTARTTARDDGISRRIGRFGTAV